MSNRHQNSGLKKSDIVQLVGNSIKLKPSIRERTVYTLTTLV